MSEHTPEPWNVDEVFWRGAIPYECPEWSIQNKSIHDENGWSICMVQGDNNKPMQANAVRIVACVNACTGMADPAAEIAALRERAEKAEAERDAERERGDLLDATARELARETEHWVDIATMRRKRVDTLEAERDELNEVIRKSNDELARLNVALVTASTERDAARAEAENTKAWIIQITPIVCKALYHAISNLPCRDMGTIYDEDVRLECREALATLDRMKAELFARAALEGAKEITDVSAS